jgi:concanavalin A-like lectin/glucanase superfamily protein
MSPGTVLRVAIPVVVILLVSSGVDSAGAEDGLVGHWTLNGDCSDSSGCENHGLNHGVRLDSSDGAVFDGIDDYIEVPSSKSLLPGTSDFSIAVQLHTEASLDDVLGDVVTKFDPNTRTGVNLSLMNYAGAPTSQTNDRNLLFGIDSGRIDPEWTDCGRPGNSRFIFGMCVHAGDLYAATWESGENERGHVYRYAGGTEWIDCGSPDECNSISALAVYQGNLYAGTSRYSGGGSSLPLSPNREPGGRIYLYKGGKEWTDCGRAGAAMSIGGLVVFRDELYASTCTTSSDQPLPRIRGLYRYEGGTEWIDCGCPGLRVVHIAVYNGHLYGMSYDQGGFFCYEGGKAWKRLGPVPDSTQVYAFAAYQGRLHVATWPTASVFRYEAPQQWTHRGRLGEELETMGMAVYNGKLYAGTLPLAAVYRHDGEDAWTFTGRLDMTPEVKYRRAWSMAVYEGKLFCGVLPSGRVLSLEAGKCVTNDQPLAPGWRHVAAIRSGDRLRIYVDGECVAISSSLAPDQYNLSNNVPLKIGFGQHDYFNGKMRDLRIYNRALSDAEVVALAK